MCLILKEVYLLWLYGRLTGGYFGNLNLIDWLNRTKSILPIMESKSGSTFHHFGLEGIGSDHFIVQSNYWLKIGS
jgi:hypothetical protein